MSFVADHWNKVQRYAGPVICVLVVALTAISGSQFWIYNVSLIAIYGLIVLGLNLVVGYVGQMTFAQTAFMALGGYGVGILAASHHWNPWLALVVAVALAVAVAVVIGYPLFRLRGHYLTMTTFALAIGVYSYANGANLTGGSVGIASVPPLTVGSVSFFDPVPMLLLASGCCLVATAAVVRLRHSRVGREWSAVASREDVAGSVGVRVRRTKLLAFVVAAVCAAVGGALYVEMTGFVSPDLYSNTILVELFVMLFIGGRGRTFAPLLGAAVVVVVPQEMSSLSSVEGIVFDVLLLVIILAFPKGLLGELAKVSVRLGAARPASPQLATVPDPGHPVLPNRSAGSAADERAELRASGLTKRFGGVTALDGVDITVRQGMVTGLIGPNGAGKSTLLSVLSGAVPPQSGTVAYGGTQLTGRGREVAARAGVVQTFQHASPIAGLTALENVLVGATLLSKGGWLSVLGGSPAIRRQDEASRQLAAALLSSLGIGEFVGAEADSLSFGQLRLLEIARAVMGGPAILLLDEPAAGLNQTEVARLGETIRQMKDRGIGFLVVDHDVPFIFGISDHVVAMDLGRVIAQGTVADVEHDAQVRSSYLGVSEQAPSLKELS